MADLDLRTIQTGDTDLAFGERLVSPPAGIDLDLSVARIPGNANLAFGSGGAPAGQTVTLTADILLSLDIDAAAAYITPVTADITLPMIGVDAAVYYDVAVWRGPQDSTRSIHQSAARAESDTRLSWPVYARPRPSVSDTWQQASGRRASVLTSFSDLLQQPRSQSIVYDNALAVSATTASRYQHPDRRSDDRRSAWQVAAHTNQSALETYQHPGRKQASPATSWQPGQPTAMPVWLVYNPRPARRRDEWRLPWGEGAGVVSLWPRPDPWQPEPPAPYVPTPDINFCFAVSQETPTLLPIGRVCGGDEPQSPVIIPIRSTYIVIHNISLTRLDDGFEIDAEQLSCSLTADAWAWQFSATLRGRGALDAVMPDTNGQPVTLVATINGYTWHLLVEDWTEDREFGKRGVSVTGRGLSAELASPYQLPDSGVTDSALTIQQLMAGHLPLGSGWTLAFTTGTPDWLVPAGAWSWSTQSPIAAIHAAAQGTGLVVVPGMDSKTLTVQPRYPVLPWDYATATPDLTVPESAILRLQRRQAVATQANAVFVHGGEVGGVLARVIRNLSAGDRVAATQSSPLITHADAARLLGGRILSGQHQQPTVRSLTMPLGGDFALGAIGNLMQIGLAGDTQHGIINAVSIEAQRTDRGTTARQSLQIGEETPNTWAKFTRLLPADPLLMGEVSTQHGDGTNTVLLAGGGTVRVRGNSVAGASVYVRSGRIEGEAPALSQFDITV